MRAEYTPKTDSECQVIEKFLNTERKRKHDLREIFDCICWLTKTGLQWSELAKTRFPPWQIVYYYFRIWKAKGIFFAILREVVRAERIRQNRLPDASMGAIDRQIGPPKRCKKRNVCKRRNWY